MEKLFRIRVFLCAAVILFAALADKNAYADFPTTVPTVAEGYVVYDATTGETILGKNDTTQFYPASITKIMTGLLACEKIADLDQEIVFSNEAIAELTPASSTLVPVANVGERMTIRDVLYGMFYVSANECAAQLAVTVAGSREAFCQMMNDRAAQIGCTGTHFVNAHGLHDAEHYSTPRDMALIMAEALKNEEFFKMATAKTYTIPQTNFCQKREMEVSHQIVNGKRPYAEVFAGKTGRTPEALRTLVTAARFGDHTVIVVIMKSSDDAFYDDTLKLLEYARGYCNGLYTGMDWTEEKKTMYVTGTNSLKVRDYPAQSGTTVQGSLSYGQQVTVTGRWGEWSQIEYMGSYFYLYSEYLTDVQPAGDNYTGETETTTRPEIVIEYSTAAPTEAMTTAVVQTSAAASKTDNIVSETTETEAKAMESQGSVISNMQEGPVKTVMIICIVLMVVIAGVAFTMNYRANQKRKRRRQQRRQRRKDDYWK